MQKMVHTCLCVYMYLVQTLRMNGAIPLFPPYVFMVWTSRTLSFFMYFWLQTLNRRMMEEINSFVLTQFIFKKSQLRMSISGRMK